MCFRYVLLLRDPENSVQVLKSAGSDPFDLVVDLTYFSSDNEIPSQWINQFVQICPSSMSERISNILIYNTNTAFRKYIKSLQRISLQRLSKKIHFIGAMNEFNEFISPIELRLPPSTCMFSVGRVLMRKFVVKLEQDVTTFAHVNKMMAMKATTSLTIKVNSEAVQLIAVRCYCFI
jgi:neurofibromin 1